MEQNNNAYHPNLVPWQKNVVQDSSNKALTSQLGRDFNKECLNFIMTNDYYGPTGYLMPSHGNLSKQPLQRTTCPNTIHPQAQKQVGTRSQKTFQTDLYNNMPQTTSGQQRISTSQTNMQPERPHFSDYSSNVYAQKGVSDYPNQLNMGQSPHMMKNNYIHMQNVYNYFTVNPPDGFGNSPTFPPSFSAKELPDIQNASWQHHSAKPKTLPLEKSCIQTQLHNAANKLEIPHNKQSGEKQTSCWYKMPDSSNKLESRLTQTSLSGQDQSKQHNAGPASSLMDDDGGSNKFNSFVVAEPDGFPKGDCQYSSSQLQNATSLPKSKVSSPVCAYKKTNQGNSWNAYHENFPSPMPGYESMVPSARLNANSQEPYYRHDPMIQNQYPSVQAENDINRRHSAYNTYLPTFSSHSDSTVNTSVGMHAESGNFKETQVNMHHDRIPSCQFQSIGCFVPLPDVVNSYGRTNMFVNPDTLAQHSVYRDLSGVRNTNASLSGKENTSNNSADRTVHCNLNSVKKSSPNAHTLKSECEHPESVLNKRKRVAKSKKSPPSLKRQKTTETVQGQSSCKSNVCILENMLESEPTLSASNLPDQEEQDMTDSAQVSLDPKSGEKMSPEGRIIVKLSFSKDHSKKRKSKTKSKAVGQGVSDDPLDLPVLPKPRKRNSSKTDTLHKQDSDSVKTSDPHTTVPTKDGTSIESSVEDQGDPVTSKGNDCINMDDDFDSKTLENINKHDNDSYVRKSSNAMLQCVKPPTSILRDDGSPSFGNVEMFDVSSQVDEYFVQSSDDSLCNERNNSEQKQQIPILTDTKPLKLEVLDFHGDSVLTVSFDVCKYVIFIELLKVSFKQLDKNLVFKACTRELKISFKQLPVMEHQQLYNFLVNKSLLGNKKKDSVYVISYEDASRLFHLFFGMKHCGSGCGSKNTVHHSPAHSTSLSQEVSYKNKQGSNYGENQNFFGSEYRNDINIQDKNNKATKTVKGRENSFFCSVLKGGLAEYNHHTVRFLLVDNVKHFLFEDVQRAFSQRLIDSVLSSSSDDLHVCGEKCAAFLSKLDNKLPPPVEGVSWFIPQDIFNNILLLSQFVKEVCHSYNNRENRSSKKHVLCENDINHKISENLKMDEKGEVSIKLIPKIDKEFIDLEAVKENVPVFPNSNTLPQKEMKSDILEKIEMGKNFGASTKSIHEKNEDITDLEAVKRNGPVFQNSQTLPQKEIKSVILEKLEIDKKWEVLTPSIPKKREEFTKVKENLLVFQTPTHNLTNNPIEDSIITESPAIQAMEEGSTEVIKTVPMLKDIINKSLNKTAEKREGGMKGNQGNIQEGEVNMFKEIKVIEDSSITGSSAKQAVEESSTDIPQVMEMTAMFENVVNSSTSELEEEGNMFKEIKMIKDSSITGSSAIQAMEVDSIEIPEVTETATMLENVVNSSMTIQEMEANTFKGIKIIEESIISGSSAIQALEDGSINIPEVIETDAMLENVVNSSMNKQKVEENPFKEIKIIEDSIISGSSAIQVMEEGSIDIPAMKEAAVIESSIDEIAKKSHGEVKRNPGNTGNQEMKGNMLKVKNENEDFITGPSSKCTHETEVYSSQTQDEKQNIPEKGNTEACTTNCEWFDEDSLSADSLNVIYIDDSDDDFYDANDDDKNENKVRDQLTDSLLCSAVVVDDASFKGSQESGIRLTTDEKVKTVPFQEDDEHKKSYDKHQNLQSQPPIVVQELMTKTIPMLQHELEVYSNELDKNSSISPNVTEPNKNKAEDLSELDCNVVSDLLKKDCISSTGDSPFVERTRNIESTNHSLNTGCTEPIEEKIFREDNILDEFSCTVPCNVKNLTEDVDLNSPSSPRDEVIYICLIENEDSLVNYDLTPPTEDSSLKYLM